MQNDEAYRFGPFVLDTARMVLLQEERQVELRPKAFQTLLVLLRAAGRVVSKDELVAAVWPDVIVNDDALAQCIRDVRKALGDAGRRYIRTVSRHGYMFVHPVEPAVPAPPPAARRRWPLLLALVGMLAAGLLAVLLWLPETGDAGRRPFARDPRLTIAVLPFETTAAEDADAWLGEGLAEDVIAALSRFRDIAVIARNSSFRYAGREVDPATVRRDLNADFLLQGSLRRAGPDLRLAVQLVDLHTGTNRWVHSFEQPADAAADLQDTIAGDVAVQLAVQAREAVAQRAAARPPRSLQAYELVLRGRKAWRSFTRDGTLEALALAERAVELVPTDAAAWALLAEVLIQLHIQPYDERMGDPATLERARAAAEQAVRLDPDHATARATLGGILSRSGNYEASLETLRQAIALNPSDADGIASYADILSRAGLHEESLVAWDAVARLDPAGTPLAEALRARANVLAGRPQPALAHARSCAARAPVFQPCFVQLAVAAQANGETEEARQAAARLLQLNPAFTIAGQFARVPYRRPEDVATLTSHLRAAGLPE